MLRRAGRFLSIGKVFFIAVIGAGILFFVASRRPGNTSHTLVTSRQGWKGKFSPQNEQIHTNVGQGTSQIDEISPDGKQACVPPQLNPDDPALKKFFYDVDPIVCNEEKDWVYTAQGKLFIRSEAVAKHGAVSCSYTPLKRETDTQTSDMETVSNVLNGTDLVSDHFKISCSGKDGQKYENIHAAIRKDDGVLKRLKSSKTEHVKGLGFNVIILGLDSLSRMAFARKLPKTLEFFTQHLKGTVLKGYNIVGDGTPQALIPILTGKTELELPRALKRLSKPAWVDVFPFVWKDYVSKGYVTAWSEDNPGIGTFTYRMVGFRDRPTDHYMRPFYVAAEPTYKQHKHLCLGHRPRYQVHTDWFKEFFTTYKDYPKFGLGFYSELTHDNNNPVGTADDTLMHFLKWLKDEGHMKNTVVVLMSDHGARFSAVRETAVGKLEERLPMFGFAFPEDFDSRFPELHNNFQKNIDRLTSPFDIYPTLRDIIDFNGEWRKGMNPRSQSLLEEVPLNRTCKSSGIENHWCACLGWKSVSPDDKNALTAAGKVVEYMNNLLKDYLDLCSELKLSKLIRAEVLSHEKDMLKFVKTNDADGFRADLTGNTQVDKETYQVKLETTPGGGHFEATIDRYIGSNKWSASTDDISRTNKYGSAPKCIEKQHEELRKYCYCKLQP